MQNIPQFVLKRLQEKAAADSHPDADLLTAFAEQSLAKGERALVLEHLAACGDCRDVVALVLPEPEMVAAAASVVPAPKWLRWPSLGWGALAAGIIVVASVGVMEYSHRNEPQTATLSVGQTGVAQAPSGLDRTPLQADVPPIAMEKKALSASGPRRADKPAGQARIGNSVLEADSNRNAAAERAAFADESQIAGAEQRNPQGEAVERRAEAGPGSSETAPTDRTVIAQNQVAPPPNGRSLADLNIVKAKDPVPPQAGVNTAPDSSSVTSSSLTSSSGQMSQSTVVRTSPLWTTSPSGVLQRSFDRGNTWQRVNPAENSAAMKNPKPDAAINPATINSAAPVFRAVAADGPEVWAGGTAGVLYHTSDGDHWTRVIPATAAARLTGDIIGIQFADSQHGRISTSTAETWTTADDGQSWQKQP